MELVRGETLAHRLHSGPLSPMAAVRLVHDLADAVQHAHAAGVIHRDLTPGNILLDAARDDTPRLTDFGVALLADSSGAPLTATLEGLGTLSYLAPEQASGRRAEQGPATDVYGLGAVLYHCLTGRPPLLGESTGALLRAVLETEPTAPRKLNPRVSRDLDTVCVKCLAKEPDRRYATAAELRDELARVLCDQPVLARRSSVLERSWRRCRRQPAFVGLSALSLLMAIALYWTLSFPAPSASARPPVRPPDLPSLVASWPVRPAELVGVTGLELGGCSVLLPSPCGRWVASGDQSGAVRVTRTGSLTNFAAFQMKGIARIFDWTPDGEWLLAGTQEGHWRLWCAREPEAEQAHGVMPSMVNSVALRPDGCRFFVGGEGRTGEFWRNDSGGTNRLRLYQLSDLPEAPHTASFNADGTRLALASFAFALLLDGDDGRILRRESHTFHHSRFTPDARHLIVIRCGQATPDALDFLRAEDGQPSGRTLLVPSGIIDFALSPDGGRVAVSSRINSVELFDIATGEMLPPKIPLPRDTYRLSFSHDGLRIFVNTTDGHSHVWDAASGALQVGPVLSNWLPWAVQLCDQGQAIVSGEANTRVHWWNARPARPAGWKDDAALPRDLERLGTPDALRLAAAFSPGNPEILRKIAKGLRLHPEPARQSEAVFLERRAHSLGPSRGGTQRSAY